MKQSYSNTAQYLAQLKGVELQIKQNQLQDAAQHLNLLVKSASHDPRLFLLGSRLAEAARNPEGMLVAARKAHQLAPQWFVATIHLAAVLASRNEAEEAIATAEQAIQQVTMQAVPNSDKEELLTKAAAVAQRLGLHAKALQWLRQAEQINPDNLSILQQIARSLIYSGEAVAAVDMLNDLLLRAPGNPTLLSDRLRACLDTRQTEQAIRDGEVLVALEPANEVYRFYLDIARGLTPTTQPAEVVTGLFDGYAARFDHHLVVQLQYKLPRDVAQMIRQWYPELKVDVLDLGSGTGLLGAYLGRVNGALIGVDLSQEMIDKAAAHHVYDRFHRVNLLDALEATPSDHYDVITALDVLTYVGELDSVIPNAHRILVPGGRFVFSCEAGAEGQADYALQSSYRYTHQRAYVQRLLEQAGFDAIEVKDRVLRQEAGEPVPGFLVTARKQVRVPGKTAQRSPRNARPARPRQ